MDANKPEPRKKAVAVRYNTQTDGAPKVVAKGAGLLADKIIEVAKEHRIHIHHDPQMVGVLAQVQLDAPIPEELYRAVAQVLAFVYRLEKRMP